MGETEAIAFLVCWLVSMPLFAIGGFLWTKRRVQKELRENPPISEKQIRAMFMSMGRKPSESQIKSVMRNMKNSK
jgi:uncharacterized protein YneF (UPF0154 family)